MSSDWLPVLRQAGARINHQLFFLLRRYQVTKVATSKLLKLCFRGAHPRAHPVREAGLVICLIFFWYGICDASQRNRKPALSVSSFLSFFCSRRIKKTKKEDPTCFKFTYRVCKYVFYMNHRVILFIPRLRQDVMIWSWAKPHDERTYRKDEWRGSHYAGQLIHQEK